MISLDSCPSVAPSPLPLFYNLPDVANECRAEKLQRCSHIASDVVHFGIVEMGFILPERVVVNIRVRSRPNACAVVYDCSLRRLDRRTWSECVPCRNVDEPWSAVPIERRRQPRSAFLAAVRVRDRLRTTNKRCALSCSASRCRAQLRSRSCDRSRAPRSAHSNPLESGRFSVP
jgi:hypothetical protein